MNIQYVVDNFETICNAFNEIIDNSSSSEIDDAFYDGNIDKGFELLEKLFPEFINKYSLTKESIKLIMFLQQQYDYSTYYNDQEYANLLQNLVDIYGDKSLDLLNIDHFMYSIKNLNPLLDLGDKYREIYKKALRQILLNANTSNRFINTIRDADKDCLDANLIMDVLNKNIKYYFNDDLIELLTLLPNEVVKDNRIINAILNKMDILFEKDITLLDYIDESSYTEDLVNSLLDKANYSFSSVFNKIPNRFKTRAIWERACNKFIDYLSIIPDHPIEDITQEEYDKWYEDLAISYIEKNPKLVTTVVHYLKDNYKNNSIYTRIANLGDYYEDMNWVNLLSSIPSSARSKELYEIIANREPKILRYINNDFNMDNEAFSIWYDELVCEAIRKCDNLKYMLNSCLSYNKITQKIFITWIERCVELNNYDLVDIAMLPIRLRTPEIIEKAIDSIGQTQLYKAPCVDIGTENISDEYRDWIDSLTEDEKNKYREWYEKAWIKFIENTNGYGTIYKEVPHNAITKNMNKACIDINPLIFHLIPEPQNEQQIKDYQELIIYALDQIPIIDYEEDYVVALHEHSDILKDIKKEYLTNDIIRHAVGRNSRYLNYVDPKYEHFDELLDIGLQYKLKKANRGPLNSKEKELLKRYAINNSDLFSTLRINILDSKIIDAIGESSLERIVRYDNIQYYILRVAENEDALKVLGFALDNLKSNTVFIEPLIEKLSLELMKILPSQYKRDNCNFLSVVANRLSDTSKPISEYERTIISYLAINSNEAKKINTYDDILNFVNNKNKDMKDILNNKNTTLVELKNAYFLRTVGLGYDEVVTLVDSFGNDTEDLLASIKDNTDNKSLEEKEALEIVIKLKSVINTQDINRLRNELNNLIKNETMDKSLMRYKKSSLLENVLRRAYGKDLVGSLSKGKDDPLQENIYNGDTYYVRNVTGKFNRMVSLLGAYRKSTSNEGDMYDRWNTSSMANNHALCYSLINQSNPGTAMIDNKNGVIIAIDRFVPEALSAAAPYDLCSDNRYNTIYTGRPQRYYTSSNMPNQSRGLYSEYDIEILDMNNKDSQYRKIQPSSIICFEEVDEDSIKAAIELSKKLGYQIPIEVIDRRKLAQQELAEIKECLQQFKNSNELDISLVETMITKFNNVRNANRASNLADELLGGKEDNPNAPFNKIHLNGLINECIDVIEERIKNGNEADIDNLYRLKDIIRNERLKVTLLPNMKDKHEWIQIDLNIDQRINYLIRQYSSLSIDNVESMKSIDAIDRIDSDILYQSTFGNMIGIPEQMDVSDIITYIDRDKIIREINDLNARGYYTEGEDYGNEYVARILMYADIIASMENIDSETRELLTEAVKYSSCGRTLDIPEDCYAYSSRLAEEEIKDKYDVEKRNIIEAAIELQSFKSKSDKIVVIEEEYQARLNELCDDYQIPLDKREQVLNISRILGDANQLDRNRFVDKAVDGLKEQSMDITSMKTESSKKLVKFSMSLADRLAKDELEKYEHAIKVDFDDKLDDIMKKFFTKRIMISEKETKDRSITNSSIVRLEYLKTIHPELRRINIDKLLLDMGITINGKIDYRDLLEELDKDEIVEKIDEVIELESQGAHLGM